MFNSALTHPKSIAVIGASNNPGKPGGQLLINLINGGFKGQLYPVNPKESSIQGLHCYNSIDELPQTDMAIIAIPANYCVETVEKMATTKNTKAFIIPSAGFAESGEEGKILEQRLHELAEKYKLAIVGPNCIGVLNSRYKAVFVSPYPILVKNGVDFVSASGAFAVFVFELAGKLGLRFGEIYSVGNSVDISVEQVLQHWDEQYTENKAGKVKLVYVEQIRQPELFFMHVFNLRKKGCHVLVIKPGDSDSGARAALSHTGALAGDHDACDYLIRKAGAIRCLSREEFVYLANILSQRELRGNKLAIITHAGGPAVLLCDQLQKNGYTVPELDAASQKKLAGILHHGSSITNPIDILATGSKEQLASVMDLCYQLDYIDGIIVIYGKTGLDNLYEIFNLLHEKIELYNKPVYPILPSVFTGEAEIKHFTSFGHACYSDEAELANGLGLLKNKPEIFNPEIYIPKPTEREFPVQKVLSDEAVKEILVACNIPYVTSTIVKNETELDQVCTDLKFPVVAKVSGILHKTEHGGVIKDIKNELELHIAFWELIRIKDSKGVMIQEMLSGMELFLGGKKHKGIGYSVHAGLGGIFVELLHDRISTLAPVSYEEALYLLNNLKTQQLFSGFRNQAPISKDSFARLLVNFSGIFIQHPEIAEIDLNPLIANGEKITVVDARIITDE